MAVVTSDRDAFQLVERARDRAAAGEGRERARADRPGGGARALRRRARAGAGLHRACAAIPPTASRALRGVGPKTAANLLAQFGTLEAALAGGSLRARSPTTCGSTGASRRWTRARRCRQLAEQQPDWARRRGEGARARAERARAAALPSESERVETHQSSGLRAPAPDRRTSGVAAADRGAARALSLRRVRVRPREEDVLRCHTPALIERVRATRGWLDADTICTETTYAGGAARGGCGDRGGLPRRLRARAPARTPRRARARDGFLHLRLDRDRGPFCPGRARARRAWRCSTGTSITGTARRRSSATTPRSSSSRSTSGPSTPGAAGPTTRARRSSTSRSPRAPATSGYLAAFEQAERAIEALRARAAARLGRLRCPRRRPARRARALDRGLRRARPARRAPRAARRRRARGRLQPRDAAGARRERARGLRWAPRAVERGTARAPVCRACRSAAVSVTGRAAPLPAPRR